MEEHIVREGNDLVSGADGEKIGCHMSQKGRNKGLIFIREICQRKRRSPGVMVTSPLVGSSCPERIFRKVDFPAPLAPISHINVFLCDVSLKSYHKSGKKQTKRGTGHKHMI